MSPSNRGLRRQTTGLLLIAAFVLIYLLVRYGATMPWTWR